MKIKIATDFSDVPWGRYPADGDFCGEIFREKTLAPALRAHALVEVDLDGAEGYGSSFLEEAFGGLIRNCGFSKSDLDARLRIQGTGKWAVSADIARTYLAEAAAELEVA